MTCKTLTIILSLKLSPIEHNILGTNVPRSMYIFYYPEHIKDSATMTFYNEIILFLNIIFFYILL